MPQSVITLLTDFGQRDGYVGIMKGVILTIQPHARIVDLAHDILPGDIDSAAFVLKRAYKYFPDGTIHVAVVDPGVGSQRRILAVKTKNYYFIAPDNGLLKWIFMENKNAEVVAVSNQDYFLAETSSTFHGRDIFAPVAAHLCRGVPLHRFGEPIDDFVRGNVPAPEKCENELTGQIIYIDRFGNLVSNIAAQELGHPIKEIRIAHQHLSGLSHSYSDVDEGELLALIGSHGNLEIAVRGGRASELLGVGMAEKVKVYF